MKSPSIVATIILVANINLVYSGEVLDTIKKDEGCTLVCTRPETSLSTDKCMCVSNKNTVSGQDGAESLMSDGSIHYIGSKITENGSEITIYKEESGDFLAIYPDREPPNHYKKSKTLKGVLGLKKIDKEEGGTGHHGGIDHKPHKKIAKQTPNIKTKSGGMAGIDKKEDGADLHGGIDHKPHKKIAKQTLNIKTKSGGMAGLVKNTDGTDKVYATITKRGAREKIKVYKGNNGDWVTYDKDGGSVRRGSGKSLEDIFKAENHEGPISARDKYRIELDKWKRAEAARETMKAAELAARHGKPYKKTSKQKRLI